MKFEGLIDKRNIRMLLGVYCNKPEYVMKYETTLADYPEKFHKIVFGAIHNIAVKNTVGTITVLDIENEISFSKSSMTICVLMAIPIKRCLSIFMILWPMVIWIWVNL